MLSRTLEAWARALAMRKSRRQSLGASIAAAFAVLAPGGGAARETDPRRRRRKNGRREKTRSRDKDKDKNRNKDRRCKDRYSEREILRYIKKAAKRYGQSKKAMVRVARCESVLDPCAVNRSGPYYGLFQFLKSTWKSTPYKDESIWDPKAQALAAAWMWKKGRKNEWACK